MYRKFYGKYCTKTQRSIQLLYKEPKFNFHWGTENDIFRTNYYLQTFMGALRKATGNKNFGDIFEYAKYD